MIVYVLLYPTNNAEKIILIRKSLTVNDFYRPRYEVVSIDDIFTPDVLIQSLQDMVKDPLNLLHGMLPRWIFMSKTNIIRVVEKTQVFP